MLRKRIALLAILPAILFALLIVLLPLSSRADDTVIASGTWGTCQWELTDDGTLTVHPGVGAEQSYMDSGPSPWLSNASSITRIVFAEEGGEKVVAPSDASHLFENLTYLRSVDAAGLDTSASWEMSWMFSDCSSLESVNLSNWDVSSVSSMYAMFNGCSSLTSLDLTGWSTPSIQYLDLIFSGCSSLATINVGVGWSTGIASTSLMFEGCYSLVGGCGTTYNSNFINGEYARIDTPVSPGYFTGEGNAKIDISSFNWSCDGYLNFVYDGETHEPTHVVIYGEDSNLEYGVDYDFLEFRDENGFSFEGAPSETGSYCAVYQGIGSYCGELEIEFSIAAANDLASADIEVYGNQFAYTGFPVEIEIAVTAADGTLLTEGIDYVIHYVNWQTGEQFDEAPSEIGEYGVYAQAVEGGSYTGCTPNRWFLIQSAKDLAAASTQPTDYSENFLYTGAPAGPGLTVTAVDGTVLTEGVDYTLVYLDNSNGERLDGAPTEVGEYCVFAEAVEVGSYTGRTTSWWFQIVAANDLSVASIECDYDFAYTGSPIEIAVTVTAADGTVLKKGTDYTLVFTTYGEHGVEVLLDGPPTDVGHYSVYAEAVEGGAYTGRSSERSAGSFSVWPINNLVVASFDVDNYYAYTGSPVDLGIIVTAADGTVLEEGIHYSLQYAADNEYGMYVFDEPPTDIGFYSVIVQAIDGSGYTDSSAWRSFSIIAANDLRLATTNVAKTRYAYTGSPIDASMTVTWRGGSTLTEGADYVLRWFGDGGDAVLEGAPSEVGTYFLRADAVEGGRYTGATDAVMIEIFSSEDLIASGTWGTCPWEIASDGTLIVHPGVGASQSGAQDSPWAGHANAITSVVFQAEDGRMVVAPEDSSRLFFRLSNVGSFDFSGLDTLSVTNMSAMFSFCRALTTLDLSELNTSSATDMSGMFNECTALISLDLSELDTSSVTNMDGMFMWCESLSSIDVSNWVTSSVENMGYLFYGCHAITSLDLSSWDTSSVTNMSGMFACGVPDAGFALTTIYVGDGWSTDAVEESGWMFNGRTALVGGNGTAFDSSHVDAEYARIDKSGTPGYLTGKSSVDIIASGNWGTCPWEITSDGTLTVHPGIGAATMPTDYPSPWDSYRNDIQKVVFLEEGGEKVVAPDMIVGLLFRLNKVETVDTSGLDTSNVVQMGSVFGNCSSLTSIDLSSWDTSSATGMWGMFQGCSSLESLDLTGWDTSSVTYMVSMFSGCSSLETVTVGDSWSTESLTNSTDMFKGCTSLVGGNGTSFDSNHVDAEYARIDKPGLPGYLTGNVVEKTDISNFPYWANDVIYDGMPHEPEVGIYDDDWNDLECGKDFVLLEFRDYDGTPLQGVPSEVGSYWVVCGGIDSYCGELTIPFKVVSPNDLSAARIGMNTINGMFAYTGFPVELGLTVRAADDTELIEGVHYTLVFYSYETGEESYAPPTEIGTYNVMAVAVEGGGYTGSTASDQFHIVAANDLSTATFEIYNYEYLYTGSPVELEQVVTAADGTMLEEGINYVLVYFDGITDERLDGAPIDFGSYYARAEAVEDGRYTGHTSTQYFVIIDPYDLASFWSSYGYQSITYDGEAHEPMIEIRSNWINLERDKDYILLGYRDESGAFFQEAPSEVGSYVAVCQGISPYHGELEIAFRIVALNDLTVAFIEIQSPYACTGFPVEHGMTITMRDGTVLTEGTDYVLRWSGDYGSVPLDGSPSEIGYYIVYAEAIEGSGYIGTTEQFGFEIVAANDLVLASVDIRDCYAYTGSPVELGLTVTAPDGTLLEEGVDYTVVFSQYGEQIDGLPTELGWYEASVVAVEGGAYTGENRWNSFRIVAANDLGLSTATVERTWFAYTGSTVDPGMTVTAPDGTVLTEGVDYELMWYPEYSDRVLEEPPVEVGRYGVRAVAIEGGDYTGYAKGFGIEIVDSSKPIASGVWGTCPWEISPDGVLTVHPGVGASQEGKLESPWAPYEKYITEIRFSEEDEQMVIAPSDTCCLFTELSNLESIDGAGFDTASVTSMFGMFRLNPKLSSLDLSGWDTSKVTNMSFMFAGCPSLSSLDTSEWDTSSVEGMEWMFIGCSSLESLNLTSWDTSKVTDTISMFYGCSSLSAIYVGDGWSMESVTVSDDMFEGCESLVGGNGTAYNPAHTDVEYARVDAPRKPGYLSEVSLIDISNATIEPVPDQPFTGSAVKPEIKVTFDGKTLVPGVDYTVRYFNNTSMGTAVAIIDGKGGYQGTAIATFQIVESVTSIPMYRLYNQWTGEHLYTADEAERDRTVSAGWTYEGIGWYAPSSGDPVYRLYNPWAPGGDHHYTMDRSEYDHLCAIGWRGEGICWYSDSNRSVPVYREYNPWKFSCNHNYTADRSEHNHLLEVGWRDEGIGWYGV